MGIKKKIVLLVIAGIYITFMSFGIILIAMSNDIFHLIYEAFAEIAKIGIFFFIYIIIILFVIPGTYLNLIVHKKNFEIKETKKKGTRKNRNLCILLLTIGIPLILWAIIGVVRYYIITVYFGGLGEVALNGFLVLLMGCILLLIIPGLILGIRSYFENEDTKKDR